MPGCVFAPNGRDPGSVAYGSAKEIALLLTQIFSSPYFKPAQLPDQGTHLTNQKTAADLTAGGLRVTTTLAGALYPLWFQPRAQTWESMGLFLFLAVRISHREVIVKPDGHGDTASEWNSLNGYFLGNISSMVMPRGQVKVYRCPDSFAQVKTELSSS